MKKRDWIILGGTYIFLMSLVYFCGVPLSFFSTIVCIGFLIITPIFSYKSFGLLKTLVLILPLLVITVTAGLYLNILHIFLEDEQWLYINHETIGLAHLYIFNEFIKYLSIAQIVTSLISFLLVFLTRERLIEEA